MDRASLCHRGRANAGGGTRSAPRNPSYPSSSRTYAAIARLDVSPGDSIP